MSFLVLQADRFATLIADEPVVSAAALPPLHDTLALLSEARRIRDDAVREIEDARTRGFAEGLEAGRAEGRAEAEADGRAELFRLAMRAGEEQRARQAELASLAMEIVRRIAGEIGGDALVAGIAARAAAEIAPETAAIIRVAPARVEAVRARIADRAGLTVEADAALAPADCVIETALGRTNAGLDTQIAQIERAWDGAGREA